MHTQTLGIIGTFKKMEAQRTFEWVRTATVFPETGVLFRDVFWEN
jgi:hypothetical protein